MTDYVILRGESLEAIDRQLAAHREDFNRRHPGRLQPEGGVFIFWEEGRWTTQAEAVARELRVEVPSD